MTRNTCPIISSPLNLHESPLHSSLLHESSDPRLPSPAHVYLPCVRISTLPTYILLAQRISPVPPPSVYLLMSVVSLEPPAYLCTLMFPIHVPSRFIFVCPPDSYPCALAFPIRLPSRFLSLYTPTSYSFFILLSCPLALCATSHERRVLYPPLRLTYICLSCQPQCGKYIPYASSTFLWRFQLDG